MMPGDDNARAREADDRQLYSAVSLVAALLLQLTYPALFSSGTGPYSLMGAASNQARALWFCNSLSFFFAIAALLLSVAGLCFTRGLKTATHKFLSVSSGILAALATLLAAGAYITAGLALDPGTNDTIWCADYMYNTSGRNYHDLHATFSPGTTTFEQACQNADGMKLAAVSLRDRKGVLKDTERGLGFSF